MGLDKLVKSLASRTKLNAPETVNRHRFTVTSHGDSVSIVPFQTRRAYLFPHHALAMHGSYLGELLYHGKVKEPVKQFSFFELLQRLRLFDSRLADKVLDGPMHEA